MLVKDRMTKHPLTIHADAPISETHRYMQEQGIRHLPVVDRSGRMVGLVTEDDLLKAKPSSATSLSVWEIHSLPPIEGPLLARRTEGDIGLVPIGVCLHSCHADAPEVNSIGLLVGLQVQRLVHPPIGCLNTDRKIDFGASVCVTNRY
jgi:CBS domain-containing protein